MMAYRDGKKIEVRSSIGIWGEVNVPSWNWDIYDYRVAIPTKPSIDWSHVSKEYCWMATGGGGATYLFKVKPEINFMYKKWNFVGDVVRASTFTSFIPGTCEWKDSLVERPANV